MLWEACLSAAYAQGPALALARVVSVCWLQLPGACVKEGSEGHRGLVVCPWQRQRCVSSRPGVCHVPASRSPRGRGHAANFLCNSVPRATLGVVSRSEPTDCAL